MAMTPARIAKTLARIQQELGECVAYFNGENQGAVAGATTTPARRGRKTASGTTAGRSRAQAAAK